jgi:hypothetical protein
LQEYERLNVTEEDSAETQRGVNYLDLSQYTIFKIFKIVAYLILGLFRKKKIILVIAGAVLAYMKRQSLSNAFIYLLNFVLFGKFKGKKSELV